jgi:hypothetical protein
MKKKFIYFVQYHPTLFLLEKESHYHFMPCRAMQELWYEVEIVSYWKELKIEDDPNFDPRFKVTYVEWIFQALVYMWKNSKNAIVYVNTFIIPSLLMWLVTKKSIFFWHESVFATEYSSHYKIKRFIVKLFYPFFTKIRVINEHDKKWLEREWFKNKWIVVPLVVSKKNLVEEISPKNDILMLWHIFSKKWPETMLKALQIVLKKYPNIKIHQVWKIDEFISSRWMTFKEELNDLWIFDNFILYWPKNNLKSLNLPTSIYINSSLQEWQCLAVYDAILLWNAVCLPNISSFRWEVLNGKTLLHKVGDYKKLADNIIWYIEHTEEKEEYINKWRKYIDEKLNYDFLKKQMQKNFVI